MIARAANTRELRAGSIFGCGVMSDLDRGRGYCFIAGKRSLRAIAGGGPTTPPMAHGDTVAVEMFDERGAIRQRVAPPKQR